MSLSISSAMKLSLSPRGNPFAAYTAGGVPAAVVADFNANRYKGADVSDYTSGATTNGTVIDSDGVLKWRAHNLCLKSTDLTQWSTKTNISVVDNGDYFTITDDATNGNHFIKNGSQFTQDGNVRTWEVEVKKGTAQYLVFSHCTILSSDLNTYIFDFDAGDWGLITSDPTYIISSSVTALADGWYRLKFTSDLNSSSYTYCSIGLANGDTSFNDASYIGSGDTVFVRKPRIYRSDLPMQNNPENPGSSYVPTTSAAVYMWRKNYVGGVGRHLVEPAAATNLLLNSQTLSTQSVTVTAAAHTLHFTGTGTVTLSGASTAGPLVGTGTGEDNRVSLTFTPSAGSLTLTVTRR